MLALAQAPIQALAHELAQALALALAQVRVRVRVQTWPQET